MVQLIETEKQKGRCQRLGGEGAGEFNGYRVSVSQDEKVLDLGSSHSDVNMLNATEMHT